MATLLELAELFVSVFEVGARKAERDVADEVCAYFGIDLRELEARHGLRDGRASGQSSREDFRVEVAHQLAEHAGSLEALLQAVVASGARFLRMVEELYAFLAQHHVSVTGGAQEFRFQISSGELDLTLSSAFVERLLQLETVVVHLQVGSIREDLLRSFLCVDGEFYGTWPIAVGNGGEARRTRHVARDMTLLPYLGRRLESSCNQDAALRSAYDDADAAMVELVSAALPLVRAHVRYLRQIRDAPSHENAPENDVAEAEYYSRTGQLRSGIIDPGDLELGAGAGSLEVVVGQFVQGPHARGGAPACVVLSHEDGSPGMRYYGSTIGNLACLCALWKAGVVVDPRRLRSDSPFPPGHPRELEAWLKGLAQSARDVARWLEREVWRPMGSIDYTDLSLVAIEYLHLPLWRERAALYEIWLTMATMHVALRHGWQATLRLVHGERGAYVWALSTKRSSMPCATLQNLAVPRTVIEVWREPEIQGLTPDIVLRVREANVDLVVVEAKDRAGSRRSAKRKTPQEIGRLYRLASRARVTWVANYCAFRERELHDAARNHGDAWTALHFGSALQPGQEPPEFERTIATALAPPGSRLTAAADKALVVLIDMTSSMRSRLPDIWRELSRATPLAERNGYHEVHAILFADHDPAQPDPYVVRRLGPFVRLAAIEEAAIAQPPADGGDIEEALEDALHEASRLLATLPGIARVLVFCDAPAHVAAACPAAHDARSLADELLSAGYGLYVCDAWLDAASHEFWQRFIGRKGFRLAALDALAAFVSAPEVSVPVVVAPARGAGGA